MTGTRRRAQQQPRRAREVMTVNFSSGFEVRFRRLGAAAPTADLSFVRADLCYTPSAISD
jgi:hypothetical protein